ADRVRAHRDPRAAGFPPNALTNRFTSDFEPSSRTLLLGSRRLSRGVVRKTAQSPEVASTVTAAPSCSPRVSPHAPRVRPPLPRRTLLLAASQLPRTILGSQAVAVLAPEAPDPDEPVRRG